MIYFIIAVFAVLGTWGLLIYIRKTMWDAVHRNLLDLEDAFEGSILRRSFAARPVFNGRINNRALTINFSTEKTDSRRRTYIDISIDSGSKVSCTISNKEWLDSQNPDKIEDFISIENSKRQEFIVRPASNKAVKELIKQDVFQELINVIPGLAYVFTGKTGIICELFTEEIVKATEFENMEKNLQILQRFSRVL